MSDYVAVIDYGLCNLDSVRRALEECGATAKITDDPADIEAADRCVLPGVGAFAKAMDNLNQRGLSDAIRTHVQIKQRPMLGVCLGMHLLGSYGEESGGADGLGLVPARIVKLHPAEARERVPHVGWNAVNVRKDSVLFQEVSAGTDYYFVHSYHMQCETAEDILATTPYCGGFVSAIESGCVMGVQFHPEKSQSAGFRLISNFLEF